MISNKHKINRRTAEFTTFAPCFEQVMGNAQFGQTCYGRCGSQTYIATEIAKFTAMMKQFDLGQLESMIAGADKLCR